MMKPLLVVALALVACGKKNDAVVLKQEATMIAKYYAPQLDALDGRVQSIFKRGTTIPGNLPGIKDVGERLQQARDTIVQLRAIVSPGPDGKSSVEKMADEQAKGNRVGDLQKLIYDTQQTLGRGLTVINDNLDSVESWIALYDRQALAMPKGEQPAPDAASPPPPPAPPAAQAPAPVAPAPQPNP